MKATAQTDFTASANGRDFKCKSGDEIEADDRTIEHLESIGLVAVKKLKGAKPGKAGDND